MAVMGLEQMEAYRAHLIHEERGGETVKKYCRDISAFFHFLPEDKSITKERVLEYKEMLAGKYKTASSNSMLVAVNGFLSFCGLGQCRVRLFRVQRSAFRQKERELTRQEYARLVRAARERKNERLELLLQTICSTGIRVSEHRFVTVESLRTGSVQISNKGKLRTVILPRELRGMLSRYCARRKLRTGPVFVTRGGRPMDRSNIWSEMKRLCAQAGVAPGKVFPHNLRHLFAFSFYRLEKDIVGLADILGHTSIDTTRIYTRTSPARYARIISRMRLLI